MRCWDYAIKEFDRDLNKRTEAKLNRLGDEGWELVSVLATDKGEARAIFKRVRTADNLGKWN